MKQVYSKPRLFAESFELIEHIAGNICAIDKDQGIYATFSSDNAHQGKGCQFVDSNLSVFIATGCEMSLDDLGEVNCYNAFSNTASMFSS